MLVSRDAEMKVNARVVRQLNKGLLGRRKICMFPIEVLLMSIVICVAVVSCKQGMRASSGGPTGKRATNVYGMTFVELSPGSFEMGAIDGRSIEKPVHLVKIKRSFYLQTTEVTQAQWNQIMDFNPSTFQGDELPVDNVTWLDAQKFVQRLNILDPGKYYRLPSEAEWEYACRAGTAGAWYGDLANIAWYSGNSKYNTHPVGHKTPNSWGFYDMLGNVWELCEDEYHESYDNAPIDGSAWKKVGVYSGRNGYVIRGGCWAENEEITRCYFRNSRLGMTSDNLTGFRLARVDGLVKSQ